MEKAILKGLEKLVVGETYRYRQLCEIFGEDSKEGSSKPAQIKKWKAFFRWTNTSTQKYKIEEIYEEPIPIEDKRKKNKGNNKGKFSELDDIIISYLTKTNQIKTTIPKFAEQIGILSEEYNKYRVNYSKFSKNNGYSLDLVAKYFNAIYSCVCKAIERSIKRLKKKELINVDAYYVLVLKDNNSEKLPIDVIKELEERTEKILGLKKYSLQTSEQHDLFTNEMLSLIKETTGLSVSYYYKEYFLSKIYDDYTYEPKYDKRKLTRKFLITICYNMIKHIYKESKQIYIDDPITGNSYLSIENDDIDDINKKIKDVIELSNYFFADMNTYTWNDYWNELSNKNNDIIFMITILFEAVQKQSTSTEKELYKETSEYFDREQMIDGLGLEDVEEIERILPDIDWERTWVDEEYTYRCAKAIEEYYNWVNKFTYSKDKFVDEYGLYVAHLIAHGKEDEQIHYYEFVHQLDEHDTRYLQLK